MRARAVPAGLAALALAGCGSAGATGAPAAAGPGEPLVGAGTAPLPLAVRLADPHDAVRIDFRHPPRAGLLFDVDTGQVLWRHNPTRRRPIASLTKIMTAIVAAEELPPGSRVPIRRQALRYQGSGVGMFRRGQRIGVSTMLHGLLLPSGNDAATALAQRAAGSVGRFVALMNRRASKLGLPCTRFTSPEGLDPGNVSCAADVAALGRALLREPRLAAIVRRPRAVLPMPIKGGRLWLTNSNPLLRAGYRGADGVKTGYTAAAGRCLLATARRGGVRLGVVLLGSRDPGRQAQQLLDRGWKVAR